MKRAVWLGIGMLLAVTGKVAAQQDVQFSQYIFNGLSVNPAYAGYQENLHLHAAYRQQWAGFPGAPKTGLVSLDGLTNAREDRVGIGGQITWDKLGPQESTSLYGSYAYRIPMNEEGDRRLSLGIGFGFTQYSLNGSEYEYRDANDPFVPLGKVSTFVPDARFGVFYTTPLSFIGVSVLDLFSVARDRKLYYGNGVTYTTLNKTRHLYVSAGTVLELSENVKLKPSFMLKEDFNGPANLDINTFVLLADRLWLGGSYRTGIKALGKSNLQTNLSSNDAVSVMLEVFANDNVRIGYSYDFMTNGLSGYQKGSHELSIGILFTKENPELSKVRCYKYF
ncbi:type IX secretion system membrane protein, PorP/SprF family [Filimonas lacunae]|uniref:Type IX secretion system membrane protein, PorP/SprF family n=1 Tax=Filimonas lacunae TaxID=477680 RepID=A0A173MK89_9BACT|nr:type IX secretion system membrane protein PorP/SprF [Filimonas lacunae]BAV07910.1 hypothetical protein FLA_3941 [Filimonas lacunae]SIT06408.1 type IX secretion system membrane protein, PorP/SprF family [Filimonas lacunae]